MRSLPPSSPPPGSRQPGQEHHRHESRSCRAVVVAAGSGTRLGGEQPKCLREVAGAPLVVHALRALAAGGVSAVVVVVAAGTEHDFEQAIANVALDAQIVVGGRERQESVLAGLQALESIGHREQSSSDGAAADAIDEIVLVHDAAGNASGAGDSDGPRDEIVLVHDAARPFVPARVVRAVIQAVADGASAAIPVVPVVDTVRRLVGGESSVVDRAELRAVQTPQGFVLATLIEAHRAAVAVGHQVTDDAGVCELAGHRVVLVEGDRASFKVTEPLDLLLAEAMLSGDRSSDDRPSDDQASDDRSRGEKANQGAQP